MVFVANTALFHDNERVDCEIFRTQDMLLFKPYFHHLEGGFPCIVLSRFNDGWRFQDSVDEVIQGQILEDIIRLNIDRHWLSKVRP
jgi:hypothetical protein